MKMKLFIALSLFFILSMTGCIMVGFEPSAENPDIVHLGERCEIYKYGECIAVVSYDDYSAEIPADQIDSVLIMETITITPVSSVQLYTNDFLLGLGYEFYTSDEDRYPTSVAYNIEKNKYDIFEQEVEKSVTYRFCFLIPKERNGTRYDQVGVSFLIFHRHVLVRIPMTEDL